MKSKFLFNDRRYISPSKKEARKFLRFHGVEGRSYRNRLISRLETTWKLKHVELAPNWAQLIPIRMDGVEYAPPLLESEKA